MCCHAKLKKKIKKIKKIPKEQSNSNRRRNAHCRRCCRSCCHSIPYSRIHRHSAPSSQSMPYNHMALYFMRVRVICNILQLDCGKAHLCSATNLPYRSKQRMRVFFLGGRGVVTKHCTMRWGAPHVVPSPYALQARCA